MDSLLSILAFTIKPSKPVLGKPITHGFNPKLLHVPITLDGVRRELLTPAYLLSWLPAI